MSTLRPTIACRPPPPPDAVARAVFGPPLGHLRGAVGLLSSGRWSQFSCRVARGSTCCGAGPPVMLSRLPTPCLDCRPPGEVTVTDPGSLAQSGNREVREPRGSLHERWWWLFGWHITSVGSDEGFSEMCSNTFRRTFILVIGRRVESLRLVYALVITLERLAHSLGAAIPSISRCRSHYRSAALFPDCVRVQWIISGLTSAPYSGSIAAPRTWGVCW